MSLLLFFLGLMGCIIYYQFKTKSGKIYGSATGQRVCVYCRKRLKYNMGASSYASVCPRCGRDQPRAQSVTSRDQGTTLRNQNLTSHYAPSTDELLRQIDTSKVVPAPTPTTRPAIPTPSPLPQTAVATWGATSNLFCTNCGQPLYIYAGDILHEGTRLRSCQEHAKTMGLPSSAQ